VSGLEQIYSGKQPTQWM